MTLHRFLIVIEKAGKNYSAHSPDLPGLASQQERPLRKQKERMHEAIGMHIRGLLEYGMPSKKSHSSATFVAVQAK
jgi:predicted RNase H-like HicB family nuclease